MTNDALSHDALDGLQSEKQSEKKASPSFHSLSGKSSILLNVNLVSDTQKK